MIVGFVGVVELACFPPEAVNTDRVNCVWHFVEYVRLCLCVSGYVYVYGVWSWE